MALITSQNPIRFAIDSLSVSKRGVITSNTNAPVNLGRAQTVKGITLKGSQPAGTYRYFAFYLDDRWGRLNTNGTFSQFTENNADFENVQQYGNTPEELAALTNIPALAGKTFRIAIALASDDPDNALPSCGIEFKCKNDTQQLTTTETSQIYELGQDAQIASLSADTSASGGGSVNVTARVTLPEGGTTEWTSLENLEGSKATTIQFRGEYKAQTAGESIAQINKVSVVYSDGSISGMIDGEIVTNTQNWYMPVKHCRLTINHAPLIDSAIKAYAAFRKSPSHIDYENLGIGSGGRKTFQLANIDGLKYDSLKLYYDGAQVFTNYEFNTEAGRVTCTAPDGVIVAASYDYGWDLEQWQEMKLSSRLAMEGYDKSEYRLDHTENTNTITAIKIVLSMKGGTIRDEILGQGTGTAKSFKLSHTVNAGSISVKANNLPLADKFWSLSDDGQYLSIAAPSGQELKATYEWISEPPVIYQYAAVFSE